MSNQLYNFNEIEPKIQAYWEQHKVFKADGVGKKQKQKQYILDMFPYPSGSGLHVGHLLGYFASDVVAIQKRMEGYDVLHPIGFDAFGLPAEQYAIDTGQHPAVTIKENIGAYKRLLKAAGLSFDWDREVTTTDPAYYRWTQWIFLAFFNSWYNKEKDRAESMDTLLAIFEAAGNKAIQAACSRDIPLFSGEEWRNMSPKAQEKILSGYRLAYLSKAKVNWCPALGTVLANDEVQNGLSERGGHPVIQKEMWQWQLRMTAYADRLLDGLATLDWPASIKEIQCNWIGKSMGAEVSFAFTGGLSRDIKVFTTRLDTLFGVTYLALAPEHPLVDKIIAWQKGGKRVMTDSMEPMADAYFGVEGNGLQSVEGDALGEDLVALEKYVAYAKNLNERTRMQTSKEARGIFTGLYVLHPFTGAKVPVWIADYVLPNYGSGAIMAVPAHDQRDYLFAKHFDLPIIAVVSGGDTSEKAYEAKEGTLINSDFGDGLSVVDAQKIFLKRLEEQKKGKAELYYRLRDPVFGRQRYWGEPFPIYYKEGVPYGLSAEQLPLVLPAIESYKPSATGKPPLSRAEKWHTAEGHPLEQTTMPAWAGSSWYFLRYMDPHNSEVFVDSEAVNYWGAVDLYVGGKEHATGHLIYARFFTKLLYDLGLVSVKEPFQKLVNQGMIQAFSRFVYRIKGTNQFVSHGLKDQYDTAALRVDISLVKKDVLDIQRFKAWRTDLADATFILEEGVYICGQALEKMSKSKYNTIDPYPIIKQYGADGLRLYLLFLGPITQSKPWSIEGIEGVARFMKKVWRLFHQQGDGCVYYTEEQPAEEAQKVLHKTIAQVRLGLTRHAFNTSISALMVCVNELLKLQCTDKIILQKFTSLLTPFAPHMGEFLWQSLGQQESVIVCPFPEENPRFLQEDSVCYPVAINGKVRAKYVCKPHIDESSLKKAVLALPQIKKYIAKTKVTKIIIIKQKMVNIVI